MSPETQGGEEGGEGGEEGGTRPLVSHNYTRPHTREVHTTVLGGGGGGGWRVGCIVTKQQEPFLPSVYVCTCESFYLSICQAHLQ